MLGCVYWWGRHESIVGGRGYKIDMICKPLTKGAKRGTPKGVALRAPATQWEGGLLISDDLPFLSKAHGPGCKTA